MSQYAQAIIDLNALVHNLAMVRRCAPSSQMMAVVKANAYGHGLMPIVKAMAEQVDGFALSSVPEASQVRAMGNRNRLLVLTGCRSVDEVQQASEQELDLVIHHAAQLDCLESATFSRPLHLWIKIDTGMHRLGFLPEQIEFVRDRLARLKTKVASVRLMSHLANGDDLQDSKTAEQTSLFEQCELSHDMERSLANSAGILGWPQTHYQWVRPGLMLYGVSPFVNRVGEQDGLKPVMQLQTCLIAIKSLRKGDAVGYGGSWRCPEAMQLGVAAIGYADGFPRHLVKPVQLSLNGRPVPLVGRVSMDLVTLDLRQHADAKIGDTLICWGAGVPVETIADAAGTIPYELLCKVTPRVAFRYQ